MAGFWKKPKVKVTKHDSVPLRQPKEAESPADRASLIKVREKVPLNSPPPAPPRAEPPPAAARDKAEPVTQKSAEVKPVEPTPAPAPTPAPDTLKVFLSYAHEDKKYVEHLRKALKGMERKKLIKIWYDRELTAGERWAERIREELNIADIIICQLSWDFLASDYCVLTELETAIRRKIAGEAELIAYVLGECDWDQEDVLREFQILPEGAKPLRDWKDRNKYWKAIAEGIRKSVLKLHRLRAPAVGPADGQEV